LRGKKRRPNSPKKHRVIEKGPQKAKPNSLKLKNQAGGKICVHDKKSKNSRGPPSVSRGEISQKKKGQRMPRTSEWKGTERKKIACGDGVIRSKTRTLFKGISRQGLRTLGEKKGGSPHGQTIKKKGEVKPTPYPSKKERSDRGGGKKKKKTRYPQLRERKGKTCWGEKLPLGSGVGKKTPGHHPNKSARQKRKKKKKLAPQKNIQTEGEGATDQLRRQKRKKRTRGSSINVVFLGDAQKGGVEPG